ncbi:MAG TPA: DUF4388 domain-containing protein [Acidimicrobiales bacterium]|nr:DUF4388 domain-containing protein [Acidimicrobiales bacterium]
MALLGTLAEFHVDDILLLLAGTKKTGVLAVEGGRRAGRIWMDAGHLVGAELADQHDAATVVFELLRLTDGKFAFEAGAMPANLGAPQDVQTVLAQARTKLAEWREIERVVPSMASIVMLDGAAGDRGPLTITAEQWRAVAAVGPGGTVAEVAGRLGLPEFDACKAVKDVVDAGLVTVTPVAEGETAPAGTAAAAPAGGSDLVRQLTELRQS